MTTTTELWRQNITQRQRGSGDGPRVNGAAFNNTIGHEWRNLKTDCACSKPSVFRVTGRKPGDQSSNLIEFCYPSLHSLNLKTRGIKLKFKESLFWLHIKKSN